MILRCTGVCMHRPLHPPPTLATAALSPSLQLPHFALSSRPPSLTPPTSSLPDDSWNGRALIDKIPRYVQKYTEFFANLCMQDYLYQQVG